MEKSTDFSMDLNLLPYPARGRLLKHLDSTDDVLNLLSVFPDGALAETVNRSKTDWMFQKVLQSLLPYLSLGEVLKCRRVSSRWKGAVDQVLENAGLTEPDYTKSLKEINREAVGRWTKTPFWIQYPWNEDESALLRFMDEMGSHSGNPFPFRDVSFDRLHMDNPEFVENVKQFLQKFGRHVWKLRVEMQFPTHKATYILRLLLEWTPNLRLLRVDMNDFDLMGPALPEREKYQIEQRLRYSGFPALPHLKQVDSYLCPLFYKYAFPQYSESLVLLGVLNIAEEGFLKAYDPARHGTFPNLKLLKAWVKNERQLTKLTLMESPLRNLEIRCASRIPLSRHLEIYSHFGRTLECVGIEFDVVTGDDTREVLRYNFADDQQGFRFDNLVKLALTSPNPLESFDVLLAIRPGLKALQILGTGDRWEFLPNPDPLFEEMPGETIQVHGYLNRMYESAIWEKIPRLETVKVALMDQDEDWLEEEYRREIMMEADENVDLN